MRAYVRTGGPPQQPPQQQPQQQPQQLPAGLAPQASALEARAARAARAMGLGEAAEWLRRYSPGLQRLVEEVGCWPVSATGSVCLSI